MVCEDAQRGKRNLSMAWIDVANAYGSVDHGWLSETFTLHKFPIWFGKVMEKLEHYNCCPNDPRQRDLSIYVLRKDCRTVIRSVLCCSFCA